MKFKMKQTLEYDIVEGNNIIAHFMGNKMNGDYYISGYNSNFPTKRLVHPSDLEYNENWNWIMPVWNKIISLETKDLVFDRVEIGKHSIFLNIYLWYKNKEWIKQSFTHTCFQFEEGKETENMQMVYWKTIVDFIKWYNKYNKPKIK